MPNQVEVTYKYNENNIKTITLEADKYALVDKVALKVVKDIVLEHGAKQEKVVGIFNFDKVIMVLGIEGNNAETN